MSTACENLVKSLSILVASVAFSGSANAAVVLINGGSSITTNGSNPGKNDVLRGGYDLQDNASIATTVANVYVQFYYLGAESGYNNTLHAGPGSAFGSHTETSNLYPGNWPGTFLFDGTLAAPSANGQILYFTSNGFGGNLLPAGGTSSRSIAFAYLNPSNVGCSLGGSMVGDKTCVSATEAAPDSNGLRYILFSLDDGGAGPDDNHDDYVGYFSYRLAPQQVVPIPAAAWLLGSGLLGLLGFARRRQVA